ncbi:MAG: hypothetical protein ACJ8CR_37865 [Roseiflexaceae bacterium]
MSMIGFLLDEHVPLLVREHLKRIEPGILVYTVGDGFAPPKGTPDPDLLSWIESNNCFLVTNNRASMPVHLADHLAQGRHVPGIVQLLKSKEFRAVLGDLLLIWGASMPGEFQDQIVYLPLRH